MSDESSVIRDPSRVFTDFVYTPASYIIFKSGGKIYAKNGSSGEIEYSGVDAGEVIQNVIDKLTTGGRIFVRTGEYTINTTITLPSDTFLEGESHSVVLKVGDNSNVNVIENANKTSGNSNIIIANIEINGNSANQTANIKGIYFENVINGEIRDCIIYDFKYSCIHLKSASYNTVLRNVIYDSDNEGVLIEGSEYCVIRNNVIYGNAGNGVKVDSSNNCFISENKCYNNMVNGIYITNSSMNIAVFGNYCYDDQSVKTQEYGLKIDSGCIEILAPHNDFNNNKMGQISNAGTGYYTKRIHVPVTTLLKPPAKAPTVAVYGVTPALEFTVDSDAANYFFRIPNDWDGDDINIKLEWTRSSTGSDDSGKTVKWQIKYLATSLGDNCNGSPTTLTVEDSYDSNDVNTQIIYETDYFTLPAASLSGKEVVAMEVSAVTPTGTALSEPALLTMSIEYTTLGNEV